MKKKYSFFIVAAFFIATLNLSCEKMLDLGSPTIVEYKVIPIDSYILQLSYNDNTGKLVTINRPAEFLSHGDQLEFINGSKTISVSTKPFPAKIEITVSNTTRSNLNYTLEILVDGLLIKTVSVNVPVGLSDPVTESVNFTIP